jgi:hypothetical protein
MIGFKLMVPWSTSGKAASQKIQTETPPKILVSEKFAHQRLNHAGLSVVCALARSTW